MTRRRWTVASLLLVLGFLSIGAAGAHELGIARIELDWGASGELTVNAWIPTGGSEQAPIVPDRCKLIDSISRAGSASELQYTWAYACGSDPFSAQDSVDLEWQLEGVFVAAAANAMEGSFYDQSDGLISLPLNAVLAGDGEQSLSVLQYLQFGVEHILSGWDHLAFVFVLCLIAIGWKLVKLVTAFTIGHSITLALATFGLVSVPAAPLEACIALSIAFMAREVILQRTSIHGFKIVLAFGLLHGLGFASALNDVGIQKANLVAALFAFNIGVEIGQLIFVAAVLTLFLVARNVTAQPKSRHAMAFAIGALGCFWTFERVVSFL